jgi:tripartite-type tricarboxylate transporter receptor subunit TctC
MLDEIRRRTPASNRNGAAMHPLQRVTFGISIAAGLACATLPVFAQPQQKFPSKPVRIVVPSSAGAGGASHLDGEMVSRAAGIKAVHVGFKGQSEALIEVLGGRVHYARGTGPNPPCSN